MLPRQKFFFLFFLQFIFFISVLSAQVKTGEGFVQVENGPKLFYKKFGSGGDTIIMVHGGPGQNMYGIGPDLEPLARNNTLIMYDQRGCGLSEMGKDQVTYIKHMTDLEAIRVYFQIDSLILVGQSWGAMLAIYYTTIYWDHVKRLLLISPGPPTRKFFDDRFTAFLKKDSTGQARVANLRIQLKTDNALSACREIFMINDRFYFANKKAIKRKKGDYCAVPPEVLIKQATSGSATLESLGNYDLRAICKIIKQPVLLMEGKWSPVPTAEMNYWRSILPNARSYIFSHSGHGYPFVEEPKKFFKIANDFFKGKWPED